MAGINMSALNSVYNYYLTTYAPKSSSPYDTHKKDELKDVSHSIRKLTRNSPLYLTVQDKSLQRFAVSVKEEARELHNTIASLGGLNEEELLNKKKAFSSDEELVTAEYIGEQEEAPLVGFSLEIDHLATGQTNLGNFLPNSKVTLPADAYSFDIHINDLNYEFQFGINDGETNLDVQKRLERLINHANIGLQAEVIDDGQENYALKLNSTITGTPENNPYHFRISDDNTSRTSGSVAYFGLDYVAQEASDAEFRLNGEPHHSASNDFTVANQFTLHLQGADPDRAVEVGLKTDVESLTENISQLIRGYNSFIKSVSEFQNQQAKGKQLSDELSGIASYYRNDLENIGLNLEKDGTISIDEEVLKKTALEDNAVEQFANIKNFTGSLLRKTNQVSLNPMNYVDKKVVAYKDPASRFNFNNPYTTGAYTGMMFNSYC